MAETDTLSIAGADWPAPPLNRKYVRAIHEYHPTQSQGAKTVPLRIGDVVLVHLTHGNGWLDGTVLGSGTRGWLPANYCQPYDHEHIRHLFHALTKIWSECANSEPTQIQGQDRDQAGFVAGVRHLLQNTRCLRSDDILVRHNLTVRRTRSNLLADLSVFVKTRDAMTVKISTGLSRRESLELKGDYMFKAFRVIVRAVRLLDVCNASAEPVLHDAHPIEEFITYHDSRPRPSPSDDSRSLPAMIRPSDDSPRRSHLRLLPPAGIVELPATASISNLRQEMTRDSAGRKHTGETSFFDDSISPSASPTKRRRTLDQSCKAVLASDLLSTKHRAFLESMGSFIGLHMQSRPLSELWQTTNQSFEACAALLTVLFAIRDQTKTKSPGLTGALVALKDRSLALSSAIPGLQRAAHRLENSAALDPAKARSLVNAATACVRCAGDCVIQARQILESHGDFMMEAGNVTVPLPDPDGSNDVETMPSAITYALNQAIDRPHTALQHRKTGSINLLRIPSSPDLSRLIIKTNLNASPVPVSSPSSYSRNDSVVEQSRLKRERTADTTPISESAVTIGYQESVPTSAASKRSFASTRATTPESCEQIPDFDQLSTVLKLCRIESDTAKEVVITSPKDTSSFGQTRSLVVRGKDNQVIAGTLSGLVEEMTSQTDMPDPTFVKAFLTTYRCFTTASDVALALIRRYNEAGDVGAINTPARLRVLKLIKQWLELYWDRHHDHSAVVIIQKFAENANLRILPASRRKLLELVDRARNGSSHTSPNTRDFDSTQQRTLVQAPPCLFDSGHQTLLSKQWASQCTVLDFDALEIARQLTLLDCRLFRGIHPTELLVSTSSNKEARAPRVSAISHMSTNLTNLVTFSILLTEDVRKRSSLLKQWALIANGCLSLQNYDTLMAIMCSLQSSTIVRLKQTWALVSPKTNSLIDYLKDIVNLSRNYASLRQRLSQAKMPCLPFVGLYLTDLTFLDAGNPSHRSMTVYGTNEQVKAINFDKWYRAFKILEDFQRFQTPYSLQDVPELQAWLIESLERTRQKDSNLNTLYKQSLLVEPNVSAPNPRNSVPFLDSFDFGGKMKASKLLRQGSHMDVFRSRFM